MRSLLVAMLATVVSVPATGAEPFERQLSEALREAHDRGADLFNAGDMASCYRLFQGSLIVAKGMLADRPEVLKIITNGLATAEKETELGKKAFQLHELIEKVRTELRLAIKKGPEALTVPPRELKLEAKPPVVGEVKSGVVGRVVWQGQPASGLEVMFVSIGRLTPRTYETVTGPQGTYTLPELPAGTYVITIVPGPKSELKKLPERYATTTTSPLRFDVKAAGEKLDFVLQ